MLHFMCIFAIAGTVFLMLDLEKKRKKKKKKQTKGWRFIGVWQVKSNKELSRRHFIKTERWCNTYI